MPLKPTSHGSNPFAEEDAALARQSWLRANMVPKAAILIGKLVSLLSFSLNIVLAFALLKVTIAAGKIKPIVVRINDVGRAEVVRLDTDYIPNEPELRDQVERFVIRYYTRNGFQIPEAIDALPVYMDLPVFEPWRKEAMEALTMIAKGEGLRRVRILSCSVLYPNVAKTTGTTATLRIAEDDMTATGAFVPGKSTGWEITLRFKIGVYPEFTMLPADRRQEAKDQWCVRNPLGMKVMGIERTRYNGADVEDQKIERVVDGIQKRAEEQFKQEKSSGLKH